MIRVRVVAGGLLFSMANILSRGPRKCWCALRPGQQEEDEMEPELMSESNGATPSPPADGSVRCDEAKLVAEAKGGSRAAIEWLVGRYEGRVLRLAYTVTRNHEDAEEITQDAFVQAFKNLHRFRGDSRFYTWLVRIAINAGLMRLRRRRVKIVSFDAELENEGRARSREIEDCGLTPERWYLQRELQRLLATGIGQLSPGLRAVFQLRDVEGFSTRETALELGLSLTAVKTRLQRARLQLRRWLSDRFRTPRVRAPSSRVFAASRLPAFSETNPLGQRTNTRSTRLCVEAKSPIDAPTFCRLREERII
jgi:RNA polymerase sigma-70 factor (ECF subfamily)